MPSPCHSLSTVSGVCGGKNDNTSHLCGTSQFYQALSHMCHFGFASRAACRCVVDGVLDREAVSFQRQKAKMAREILHIFRTIRERVLEKLVV